MSRPAPFSAGSPLPACGADDPPPFLRAADRNIQLFTTGPASVDQASDQSSDAQAWKVEQSSLAALVGLVAQSIEAVSFILLLIDYKLPEILAKYVFSLSTPPPFLRAAG